ncbi:MAG: ribose 5-phosphate isomerase B [Opitutales bacterium]|nr:ribose 5-phosphate isomerase B [Opitutales bacterium]
MSSKKFSIGSDHGGFELKQALISSLEKEGYEVIDCGCFDTSSVDYPDFAKLVCNDVNAKNVDFGVLVCTSGIGMSIAANKVNGIRAALCLNLDAGKFSRLHNNANVCCLGAKYLDVPTAVEIVKTFSNTEFEGGRHCRRVDKFMDFENE